ncbi:MAG: thermonuclease family protein [Candidatus Binatia bacterium]
MAKRDHQEEGRARGAEGIGPGSGMRYVFLEDGTFLNAEIVKQGFGFAYTRFPFKYLDEFRRFEREAREHRSGLYRLSTERP